MAIFILFGTQTTCFSEKNLIFPTRKRILYTVSSMTNAKQVTILKIDRIIYVGEDEYPDPDISFPPQNAKSDQFVYQLTGEDEEINYDHTVVRTRKDAIRFHPQGPCGVYTVKRRVCSACVNVAFQLEEPLSPTSFAVDASKNKKLRRLFLRAFSEWSGKRDGYYLRCMAILYEILSEIGRELYAPDTKRQILKPALEYIAAHYPSENIPVGTLSKLCGVSASYLKKLFIECFGVSPKRYILSLRKEYATELLSSGLYTVSAVAEKMGYDNVYYFSTAFKRETGLPPGEYVKKCKSSK